MLVLASLTSQLVTRSSQQTYIQRLGFQDKDRSNVRHGLACEYLLNRLVKSEWMASSNLENEIIAALKYFLTYNITEFTGHENFKIVKKFFVDAIENKSYDINKITEKIQAAIHCSRCINVPIVSGKFVNGFADVVLPGNFALLVKLNEQSLSAGFLELEWTAHKSENQYNFILGEVKITPEPAENIIQQIAFYREYLHAKKVIILVDYDAPQLKRMTEGSDIFVYRLGNAFEEWCAEQLNPEIDEF